MKKQDEHGKYSEYDDKILYAAFKARDPRFDGRFYVGVKSTGIYCRSTCRAKMPVERNCTFFHTAAEAEAAGFRPCLTCRPELAPGFAPLDSKSMLAERAARFLEEQCCSGRSLEELAAELGYTDRYLRQVFSEAYHVTPIQYMQTCRLLLSKELLTDTALPVTDVAMISGFGSIRRFNDAFKKRYRMAPTDLRKKYSAGKKKDSDIKISLGYRKPYRWDLILEFFKGRELPGVEFVNDGTYYRTVRLKDRNGSDVLGTVCVANNPDKSALEVSMSDSLLCVMPQLLVQLKNLFDLYCDPDAVGVISDEMEKLRPGAFIPGIRIPGCADPFEMSVRAVLGQQITVKAARTLVGRFAERFGTPVKTDIPQLRYAFPSAEEIAALGDGIEDELGSLGIIARRASTIGELARIFVEPGKLGADPEKEIEKLVSLKGIGPWTANYIAMRALGHTDAFLEADYGVKKVFSGMTPKEIRSASEAFRPWRSYAMMMIWQLVPRILSN